MRSHAGTLLLLLAFSLGALPACESKPAQPKAPKTQPSKSESSKPEAAAAKESSPAAQQPAPAKPAEIRVSGERALEDVRRVIQRGARLPGSYAHRWAQAYIIRQLRLAYAEVEEVDFVAQTPQGAVAMKNIIGKIPGRTSDIVVLAGHYDTARIPGFVGANDGGSSTALLLELARVLGRQQPNPVTIWVVFFDGEEAFQQWSESDGLYGSRYQASVWERAGVLGRIKALILVDMIGDKKLALRRDLNSTPWLVDLVWQAAREKGYEEHFLGERTAITDDHVPFVRAGVAAVDLIDMDYGPGNGYWHTAEDTMDKLSPRSFEIMGAVVLEAVARLWQRWPEKPALP